MGQQKMETGKNSLIDALKSSPYLLVAKLIEAMIEDRIIGGLNHSLDTHREGIVHLLYSVLFQIAKMPWIAVVLTAIGILLHSYWKENNSKDKEPQKSAESAKNFWPSFFSSLKNAAIICVVLLAIFGGVKLLRPSRPKNSAETQTAKKLNPPKPQASALPPKPIQETVPVKKKPAQLPKASSPKTAPAMMPPGTTLAEADKLARVYRKEHPESVGLDALRDWVNEQLRKEGLPPQTSYFKAPNPPGITNEIYVPNSPQCPNGITLISNSTAEGGYVGYYLGDPCVVVDHGRTVGSKYGYVVPKRQ